MHSIFIINGFGIWNPSLWAGLVADLWQEAVLYFIIRILTGPYSCEMGRRPVSQYATGEEQWHKEAISFQTRPSLKDGAFNANACLRGLIAIVWYEITVTWGQIQITWHVITCLFTTIESTVVLVIICCHEMWLFSSACYDDWWRQVAVLYRWQHIKVASL